MPRGAILTCFRPPTQEEYERHLPDATVRLWRKYPQLRDDGGEKLREDGFVKEMLKAMVVWIADTPDWSTIP